MNLYKEVETKRGNMQKGKKSRLIGQFRGERQYKCEERGGRLNEGIVIREKS